MVDESSSNENSPKATTSPENVEKEERRRERLRRKSESQKRRTKAIREQLVDRLNQDSNVGLLAECGVARAKILARHALISCLE